MQDTLKKLFPNYEENKYINELPEIGRVLVSTAKIKLNEENLNRILPIYKRAVGIIK